MQTPATHDVKEEEPESLSQVQHSKYRSQVARCLFFSQDRADMAFIVNELCQRMSNPTQQRFAKLKRLVTYLKRERQRRQLFIQLWKDGRYTVAETVDEVRPHGIATFSAWRDGTEGSRVGVGGDGTEGSRVGVCGSPWSSVGGMTSRAEVAAGGKSVAEARPLGVGVQRAGL